MYVLVNGLGSENRAYPYSAQRHMRINTLCDFWQYFQET